MAFEPSIRGWRVSPPSGTWAVTYHPPERPNVSVLAGGHLYTEVLQHIRAWRTNNHLPPADAEVFSYCDKIWCSRDKIRCTQSVDTMPDVPPTAPRRTLTPADYGRAAWGFLGTFGVHFSQPLWISAIQQVQSMLSPHNPHNNGAGCPACHGHFSEFCQQYPYANVHTAEEAAVFVWLAHDGANVWAGKHHRPTYRQAATLHGWVILSDDAFAAIQARLRA